MLRDSPGHPGYARHHNPHPPGGLARANCVIARLGDWNCYGKPPGPITMDPGVQRLLAIHQGRLLALIPERDVCMP